MLAYIFPLGDQLFGPMKKNPSYINYIKIYSEKNGIFFVFVLFTHPNRVLKIALLVLELKSKLKMIPFITYLRKLKMPILAPPPPTKVVKQLYFFWDSIFISMA